MFWIIAIAALVILAIGPLIWDLFVHPIRSAAILIKLALGVGGIVYLILGVILGHFGYGAIGVILLIGASAISAFQARRDVY
ncbi:hypothetical protein [Arthrobacter pigmenti]